MVRAVVEERMVETTCGYCSPSEQLPSCLEMQILHSNPRFLWSFQWCLMKNETSFLWILNTSGSSVLFSHCLWALSVSLGTIISLVFFWGLSAKWGVGWDWKPVWGVAVKTLILSKYGDSSCRLSLVWEVDIYTLATNTLTRVSMVSSIWTAVMNT